jgi:hypothetical protein
MITGAPTAEITSPVKNGRKELGYQAFVVRSEPDRVTGFVSFAVEVVRVERADSSENLLVLLIGELRIRVFSMPSGALAQYIVWALIIDTLLTDRNCDTESWPGPQLVDCFGL